MKHTAIGLCLLMGSATLVAAQDTPTYYHRIKVKDPAKNEFLSVKLYKTKIKVEYLDGKVQKTLEADLKADAEKKKYKTPEGATLGEVKLGDDGFKIRDAKGKLQWKVKTLPGKIKISDNEENENPIELKISDDKKKIKVFDRGAEVAEVKFYPDTGTLKLKDSKSEATLFEAKTKSANAMMGVLGLDRIPLAQRVILAAELSYRERPK